MRASSFLLVALALGACGDVGEDLGSVSFPLTEANFFRLRIFEGPAAIASGEHVFDTGCIQRQSRTYELVNIPVGSDYAVLYEGFPIASCASDSRVEVGYRGLVDIEKGKQPYYHIPVYPVGRIGTLPEDLNLSASVATDISFCDGPEDCTGALDVCYAAAAPQYWCVPSCKSDADCTGLHPRATCDLATEWCMLRSPYPLNLSEPRALGAATTLRNGDVLFVGGLRDAPGGFGPTSHWLERFDAQTGLLAPAEVEGANGVPAGLFGFAALAPDRFVAVGGVGSLSGLRWDASGPGLVTEADWATALLSGIVVFDIEGAGVGQAKTSTLSRAVSQPTIVPLGRDRFWVAGGLVASGGDVAATKSTSICTIDASLVATCAASVELKQPRFAAAASCLDATCSRVLLVGGNVGGRLAEIVDFTANSSDALETLGVGDKAFQPLLCGMDLVGGSTASTTPLPFKGVHLTIDGRLLDAKPITNAASSVFFGALAGGTTAFGATPTCFIGGGFGADGALASVQRVDADGFEEVSGATFGQARFGAVAATIGSGPLEGRVIFGGGLSFPAGVGPAAIVRGLEVLSP